VTNQFFVCERDKAKEKLESIIGDDYKRCERLHKSIGKNRSNNL